MRATIIYVVANFLMRISKRRAGEFAPFDLIVLMLFGSVAGRVTLGVDVSLAAGITILLTVCGLDMLAAWASSKSKRLERFLDGRPAVLIHDGTINQEQLNRNRMTREQLIKGLRAAGCSSILDVHYAMLETNGRITVRKWVS